MHAMDLSGAGRNKSKCDLSLNSPELEMKQSRNDDEILDRIGGQIDHCVEEKRIPDETGR
jgi:hypothetical protein